MVWEKCVVYKLQFYIQKVKVEKDDDASRQPPQLDLPELPRMPTLPGTTALPQLPNLPQLDKLVELSQPDDINQGINCSSTVLFINF